MMLEKLQEAEAALPALLCDNNWNSLLVDYHHPRVHRLWRQFDDKHRLLLHKIHSCEEGEALLHPHPWPSAMRIYTPSGASYETGVGRGNPHFDAPPMPAKFVLKSGSSYEMVDDCAWHYVRPLDGPIYSVMVIGKPWSKIKQERFGQLREHKQLNEYQIEDLREFFRGIYR